MVTLQQLKKARAAVKTGADFPRYICEIKKLGLRRYEFMVIDGSTTYYAENGHKLSAPPEYNKILIAPFSSIEDLHHSIVIHQQGQTDFVDFCKQAAAAGVDKWVVDTKKMTCTYYDLSGKEMIAEPIPQEDLS